MADTNQSTQDRLRTLDASLESLERITPPPPPPPPRRAKLPRVEPSPRERRIRRWLFWAIQGWGALVFVLMVAQAGDDVPIWQWPVAAAFICAGGWMIYGFHLFYWELAKDMARWARGRFGSGSDKG